MSNGAEETCAAGTSWFAEANKWSQLTPTGSPPSVRAEHTAAYSEGAGGMLVFGGWGSGCHRLRASERGVREETGMEPRGKGGVLRGKLNDLYLYEVKARGEQRFSGDLLRVW